MNEEEIKLLNEIKENCLNCAKYVDPKAMEKYNLLRKIEDRINELYQENKQLKEELKATEFSNKLKSKTIDNLKELNETRKQRIYKALNFISKVDGVLGERHKIILKNILEGESNE